MQVRKYFKFLFYTFLFNLLFFQVYAQSALNFQGVARSNNSILASQFISLKLSILQGGPAGVVDYVETRSVMTNAQGLFSVVIGDTGAKNTIGNFSTIHWKNSPKFLKIEMDPNAGNNFTTMGITQLQSVPYAHYAAYANSVEAENIKGTIGIAQGGTGLSSLSALKTTLGIDKINNTSDTAKPISNLMQAALDSKLSIYGNAATATSANTSISANKLTTPRNINGVPFDGTEDILIPGNWAGTANYLVPNASITAATKTKLTYDAKGLVIAGADATTADIAPSVNRNYLTDAQAGVLSNTSGMNTGDETLNSIKTKLGITTLSGTNTGDQTISLTGDITGTGSATFTTTLSNTGVVSGTYGSSTNIPSFTVDAKGRLISAGASNVQVDAGNLTGTTLNSTITNSSLTGLGTISSGTWSATPIAVTNGGTGLTSPGAIGNLLTSNGTAWVSASPTGGGGYELDITSAQTVGGSKSFTSNMRVGTTSPTASAVFELSSTSKGFLPPRMTEAQRNAIVSPVKGLMVFCTNCDFYGEHQIYNGSTWVNLTGAAAASIFTGFTVGQKALGGIIAYILVAGDPGYDPNVQHGLVASITDLSTYIVWHVAGSMYINGTSAAFGTGLSNTNLIINSQGASATNYAAKAARSYNGGGYNDWYLPSKDELNKLYLNRNAIGNIGLDYGTNYWTSTEYESNNNYAWSQGFLGVINGSQVSSGKTGGNYVRPIRSF